VARAWFNKPLEHPSLAFADVIDWEGTYIKRFRLLFFLVQHRSFSPLHKQPHSPELMFLCLPATQRKTPRWLVPGGTQLLCARLYAPASIVGRAMSINPMSDVLASNQWC
jgi:hypothetical protein